MIGDLVDHFVAFSVVLDAAEDLVRYARGTPGIGKPGGGILQGKGPVADENLASRLQAALQSGGSMDRWHEADLRRFVTKTGEVLSLAREISNLYVGHDLTPMNGMPKAPEGLANAIGRYRNARMG